MEGWRSGDSRDRRRKEEKYGNLRGRKERDKEGKK